MMISMIMMDHWTRYKHYTIKGQPTTLGADHGVNIAFDSKEMFVQANNQMFQNLKRMFRPKSKSILLNPSWPSLEEHSASSQDSLLSSLST